VPGSIKNWAVDDRPREKLIAKGVMTLSDSELVAILISSGNKKESALDLAKKILELGKNNLNELGKLSLHAFTRVNGIGQAKAVIISAALELGRRRYAASSLIKMNIKSSVDIADFLRTKYRDLPYEIFAVVYLNRANKINSCELISSGGITGTVADPRIILKRALEADATSIVLCHNHPSGSLQPSKADEDLTHKIKEAAGYLDIRVLDHIIVSEEGYFSFADEGIL